MSRTGVSKAERSSQQSSFAEQLIDASRSREFPDLYVLQNVEYGNLQQKGLVPKSRPTAKAFDDEVAEMSAVFRGDYKEGRKNGHGEAVLEDDSLLSAEFINGEIEGAATIVAPNGFSFVGQVSESKDEFKGTVFVPKRKSTSPQNAFKVLGSHLHKADAPPYQPIKYGLGMVFSEDGSEYVGGFLNGRFTLTLGLKHGYGMEVNSRETKFKGFWKEDKRHGEGISIDKKGVTIYQKWENGMLICEKKLN